MPPLTHSPPYFLTYLLAAQELEGRDLNEAWRSPHLEPLLRKLKRALLDTTMVDAAWLAELADSGGILPRCQDVPDHAKVSLAEMEAWDPRGGYTVGCLIVS